MVKEIIERMKTGIDRKNQRITIPDVFNNLTIGGNCLEKIESGTLQKLHLSLKTRTNAKSAAGIFAQTKRRRFKMKRLKSDSTIEIILGTS